MSKVVEKKEHDKGDSLEAGCWRLEARSWRLTRLTLFPSTWLRASELRRVQAGSEVSKVVETKEQDKGDFFEDEQDR
ncbi:MAG: hypothetical protein L0191_13905 [Acidobacteria bacterium]|nr:hypothetical protein [Acidobacteriota bacterium]